MSTKGILRAKGQRAASGGCFAGVFSEGSIE